MTRNIEQFLVRAQYALEPTHEDDREEYEETTGKILLSVYQAMKSMNNNEREAFVNEIEAMFIGRELSANRPKLVVVKGRNQ